MDNKTEIQNFINTKKKKIIFFFDLSILILVWLCSYGVLFTVLPSLGISTLFIDEPFFYLFYFCFWIFITLFILYGRMANSLLIKIEINFQVLKLLFLGLAFISLYYFFIHPLLLEGVHVYDQSLYSRILSSDPGYLLVKIFEIGLQQLLIYFFVKILWGFKNSKNFVYVTYAIVFTIAHLFTYFFVEPLLAVVFTFGALLSTFIFPPLIINYKNGFVYSYLAHWFLYISLNVILTILISLNYLII